MAKSYITVQGDTWDSIALKFYENEKLLHYLTKANPKYMDVVIFSANITLNIPELDVPIMGTSNDDVPYWRR